MKTYLGVAMTAVLLLSACAQPKPAAPAAAAATAGAPADQTQTASAAPVKKKKCSDQTGSRLAPCGESSDAVQGASGQDVKDSGMLNGSRFGAPK